MITHDGPFLKPAGYFIVQSAQQIKARHGQTYYGLDRCPPFIAPDRQIRERMHRPLIQDMALYRALDEWFDTTEGLSAFMISQRKAFRLFQALGPYASQIDLLYCELEWAAGEEERANAYANASHFELLYCELAWQAGEEERAKAYVTVIEKTRPIIQQTYGFDVSWPSCKHSAIFQPGVVPGNPSWLKKLNEWGLLAQYTDALLLRDEYIAYYPYPPFDIYLVHKVA